MIFIPSSSNRNDPRTLAFANPYAGFSPLPNSNLHRDDRGHVFRDGASLGGSLERTC
jgi:hypothetical protein